MQPPAECPAHQNIALYGPEYGSEPDAVYSRLRGPDPDNPRPSATAEIAPDVPVEVILGYDAALHILQHPGTFVRDSRRWNALNEGRIPADSPAIPMMAWRPNALFSDGAAHLRLREAVVDSLATVPQHRVMRLSQTIGEYLISQFETRPVGQADLVADYAVQHPLLVFSDLFGCPASIGDQIIQGITGIFEGTAGANEVLSAALMELIVLKRRQPGDDITTHLMRHPVKLSDQEVADQMVTLLSGGTAPLTAGISTGAALMLGDEKYTGTQSMAGLPVDDAVNEVMWRYAPIANYAAHYPNTDVDLNGRILRKNDPVIISFAAANTDPYLSQDRQRLSPQAHLAFGAGPHACPAKDPALVIVVTAIETLLKRLPDVELRVPFKDLTWGQAPWTRSLPTLPVRFSPKPVPTAGQVRPSDHPRVSQPNHPRTAQMPEEAQSAKKPTGFWSRFLAWSRGE
jgi:cytochrome P450